jgi:hypothetical protein
VLSHFTQLKLCNLNVSELDAGLKRFPNLTELNVSGNSLTALKNLPESIVSMCAYANSIVSVDVATPPLSNCIHLGIGYNRLPDGQLTPIVISFPNVVVLDVSFNSLANLDYVVSKLELLTSVEHLVLYGNPCALVYGYRQLVLSSFPRLKSLDDVAVPEDTVASSPASEVGPSPPCGQVVLAARVCNLTGLVTAVDILGPPVDAVTDVGKGSGKPAPAAAKKGACGVALVSVAVGRTTAFRARVCHDAPLLCECVTGSDKKGEPVVEAPVPTEPLPISDADCVLYATLTLPNGSVHTSSLSRSGSSSANLDENESTLMFSPTVEFRDAFLRAFGFAEIAV